MPNNRLLEGVHVLIVEDDLDIRYFVSAVLILAGALATATTARDVAGTALTADVIVCGLATAEAAGPELLDRLRRQHARGEREVPVIVLLPPGGSEASAHAAGFQHFLRRPLNGDDLRALVWTVSQLN